MRLGIVGAIWIVAAFLSAAADATETVSAPSEQVHVIDGDTLEVGERVVQLYGIDAPELGQICMNVNAPWHCGIDAARALRKLISVEHASVRCHPVPVESRVFIAVCMAGSVDLAKDLVASGQAVAVPGAFADYVELERRVKAGNLGMWRGAFVAPSDWRAGRRLPGEEAERTRIVPCPVKATVGSGGRKVYYVPTDLGYESVKLDPSRGERCFLSDEDARAGGWSLAAAPPGAPPGRRRSAPL